MKTTKLNINDDLFMSSTSSAEIFTKLGMSSRFLDTNKIWTQLFYFEGRLVDYFKKPSIYCSIEHTLSDGGIIIRLKYRLGRKIKLNLNGIVALLPSSQESIYRAVAICNSTFWNKAAMKFLENSYPRLVRIFFRQEELKRVLFDFESKLSERFNVTVKDLTTKERRLSKTSDQQDKYDSERKWTESALEKAFNEAKERGQWFNSLRMALNRTNRSRVEAFIRITKYGLVSQDHFYELSLNYILPPLEFYAYSKTTLFSKRGLKERNYIPSVPLAINYDVDLFDNTKNVRKLVRVLKRLPNSSKAVYHGNPYLHMSVADFKDGSSYELWVLNPRRIIIIPQLKTSIQSLERLVSYVFDKFGEGEVSEVSNV